MSLTSPSWLAAAAIMAVGVVLLHLLARRRPRLFAFPTARFIPDQPATAASLARRPTDLFLLLLRVLTVLLLGLAFARPVASPPSRTVHIVLLDRSRLAPPVDSSNAALLASANLIIAFDTSARVVDPSPSLELPHGSLPGSLSAGLIAAVRRAPRMAALGDSLALTIISPFAREEWDSATLSIRELWKGRINTIAVPPVQPVLSPQQNNLSPADPLAATLALLNPSEMFPVRLIRDRPDAADSAFAAEGGTLVVWPRAQGDAEWPAAAHDTSGGIALDDEAVVAAFVRWHRPPPGEIIALWHDGEAAVTLQRLGEGCIRNVAIALPESGDLVLRPSFQRFTRKLLAPCNGWTNADPVAVAQLDSLRGAASLMPASDVQGSPGSRTPANPWLLLAAAFIYAAEPAFRRRRAAR